MPDATLEAARDHESLLGTLERRMSNLAIAAGE
jgi:hypothetical protein